MTNPNNILTGLMALEDYQLTHSQRNRCITLFAMQDDPFGMLSQWLYSKALERGNRFTQTIKEQQDHIDQINAIKDFLLDENLKMNLLIHKKKQETAELEQLLLDDLEYLKLGISGIKTTDDLVAELEQLEKLNKMLVRSLYQAMREIQKLITLSN